MHVVTLTTDQIKQLITLIGSLQHPEASNHIDGKELMDIQHQLAEVIDEVDNAWRLTHG